MAKFAT